MPEISLPYEYNPRGYQKNFWKAFDTGKKRLLLIWHRRAGKDKSCLNLVAREMQRRVGAYYYFLPTGTQARKVIWEGMDFNGFRFMDHFPHELRKGEPNNTEMKLTYKNGSIFRLVGSDNFDSVMGTNPVGLVMSEWSLSDPASWDYMRPILRENGGWALFNGTPRGKNHLYKLYQMALKNPEWFVEKLGIDETGVMSPADVQMEIDSGMSDERAQQEFYCSFEGGMEGAYYADQMRSMERGGRVRDVPYDPSRPVDTWWDIGVDDATAIVFVQVIHGSEIHIIDYYETSGEGLPHYIHVLSQKPYLYGEHIAPHDMQVRDFSTGKSRIEAARELGIDFKIAPKFSIHEGIDAVRRMLPMCWVDQTKCDRLLDAMSSYRKEKDEKLDIWKNRPVHDWSSHAADAMRMGATGRRNARVIQERDKYRRTKPLRERSWLTA